MTGVRIRESWGMTETTAVTCITPRVGQVKVGSSGVRLPYQQVRVVVSDGTGTWPGTARLARAGLVIVRGPSVFPANWARSRLPAGSTATGWTPATSLLRRGRLAVDTGRSKDLIIRADTTSIRRWWRRCCSAIRRSGCRVVGAADAHAGEVPVAYVVLKPGASALADSVLRYAAEHMPERAAIPKHAWCCQKCRRRQFGKIQKNLLRVDAIERMFRAALDGIGRSAEVQATDRGSRGFFVEIECRRVTSTMRPWPARCAASLFPMRSDLSKVLDRKPTSGHRSHSSKRNRRVYKLQGARRRLMSFCCTT